MVMYVRTDTFEFVDDVAAENELVEWLFVLLQGEEESYLYAIHFQVIIHSSGAIAHNAAVLNWCPFNVIIMKDDVKTQESRCYVMT